MIALVARLFKHPGTDIHDQPGFFRNINELVGVYQAVPRVISAQQGFGIATVAGVEAYADAACELVVVSEVLQRVVKSSSLRACMYASRLPCLDSVRSHWLSSSVK